jgi:UDP-N-acetylmuramate dehydrogenase
MNLPPILLEQLLVREDVALGPLTTLGVGGPAPWVLEPRTRAELILAVAELRRAGLPFRMLGHGSNLIVTDDGVPEVVIHTRTLQGIYHHGEIEHAVRVEAGASLARLISVCHQQGLAGVESLVGIPGTVGGAVVGNAGGRHGCLGDCVVEVTLVGEDGEPLALGVTPDDFGYRTSPFKGPDASNAGAVVVDVVLQLTPEAPTAIWERMSEVLSDKRSSQPLAARSAGCIFRNSDSHPSSRLIEEAGCKGMSHGGAVVSDRHSNFILNTGDALAADVLALVERVQSTVKDRSGQDLELEIEVWGGPKQLSPRPDR